MSVHFSEMNEPEDHMAITWFTINTTLIERGDRIRKVVQDLSQTGEIELEEQDQGWFLFPLILRPEKYVDKIPAQTLQEILDALPLSEEMTQIMANTPEYNTAGQVDVCM